MRIKVASSGSSERRRWCCVDGAARAGVRPFGVDTAGGDTCSVGRYYEVAGQIGEVVPGGVDGE